jgi:hypothetical protein
MAKKHDPFFVHLWHELSSAELLQETAFKKWLEVPAKLQSQFITAARRAMQGALGVPQTGPKPRAAKKKAPKTKVKAKVKTKAKAKTATKRKVPASRG